MKIAFFGTGDFSESILSSLNKNYPNLIVEIVVSQPDKPVGRKQILTPPPVKVYAQDNNLECYQPEKLRNNVAFQELLREKDLDFIVVVAYGKIIPKEFLEIPKYGCINIHGSILPNYRGASPVQESLKHGDHTTGITIMYMSEGMDEGDILSIHEVNILPDETSDEIFVKFSQIGPDALVHTLDRIVAGNCTSRPQNHQLSTYCTKISKEDGRIHFGKQSGREIYNLYRAYHIWPGIYSEYQRKKIEFTNVSFEFNDLCLAEEFAIGDVVEYEHGSSKHIAILTSDGLLILHRVKLEGKKEMDILSFVRGNGGLLEYHFE